jgi:hypothetical protein
MTDDSRNQEPEDLVPTHAELEPGAKKRRLNPEQMEGVEPEHALYDDPDEEMPPADGTVRPRNKKYPNVPPMPGALPG